MTSLPRRLSLRAFWVVLVSCAGLAGGFLFSTPLATASEVELPTIASVEVTDVTETSVTLVAQVNPNDSEGEYEFRLVQQGSPPAFRGEPIPGGPQVHQGHIGTGEQTVSAVITDLQPGHLYWYVLVVTNSEQRAKTGDAYFSFHYSGGFPEGIGGAPYEAEIPEWAIDSAEEQAAKAVREYEAKQRQAEKEQEEQRAKEAVFRTAEAAALKQRKEEEAKETAAQATGSALLAATRIMVKSGRVSLLKLSCLGSARCHGKLTLLARGSARSKAKKRRARTVIIGAAGFSIVGDETKTVEVDINTAGRSLLNADHGHLTASLTILELAPNPESTVMKTVHLIEQKTQSRQSKR